MINYLEELLNTIQDTFSLSNICVPENIFEKKIDVIQYQYNNSFYYVDKQNRVYESIPNDLNFIFGKQVGEMRDRTIYLF
jgi:hypothetical protein